LEQELFGTEASSQEWSFDLEEEATVDPEAAMDWDAVEFPQAAEPTALESSQASELEALWGEQTLEDTEGLDFLAVEPDALNLEQELFGTEASSQEWSFSSEEEATVDPEAAMDWDAAEFPQAAEPTALESSQASELEALWGEQTLEDTDAVEAPEENLFETEMASDWDLESAEEAAEDSLDWEGAGAVDVGDLDDFLGSELDDFTDAQDWDEVLTTAQDSSWDGLDDLLEEGVEERNVVEDDFSFLTAQEADQTQVDEFDDLEAMLAEETTFLAGELDSFESDRGSVAEQSSADLEDLALGSLGASALSSSRLESEFDDLEAMLAEEGFEASAAFESADMDGFDDLEALLGEQTPASAEQSPAPAKRKARDTDALDDEFGDLEILLEQADKTMVGPPMAAPDQRQTRPSIRARPRVFEQTMRVPVKHLDSLSNLVGELVVNRNSLEQDQERLRQFLDNLSHQVLALSDVGARMQDLYERSLLESSLLASRQSYRSSFHAASSSHNNSNSSGVEYDPLEMDRFTGFHLLSQEMIELIVRVRESASDIEFLVDETDQVARMLRQVTTQLQEGLTRSRMVPFAQNADRLLRAVHEISRKLGKEAQLHVDGRETLIDKMILEHLYDPMTHLVNNALTHGIEMPEVRRAAGKPIAGQITLRAFLQGNQTVISISDDGAGINPEKIRSKVIEKRLITPAEAKTLTRLDLYDFLFHPGFTTKDKADDFSGRGVGMDVVRTSLSEIRGTIHIDSTIGKGTTFTIRLPLTLSICKALCCLSERARIAFPMDGVEDMLDLSPDRIQTNSEGQTCIQWRDTLLPFQSLSELLKYNRQVSRGSVYGGKREDNLISIVVLRSAGNFIAIQVDQVLGEQEIVIKQLEGPAPKPVGIAGATVLGDGRIMPIADVLELIDLAMGRIRKDGGVTIWSRENPQDPESQEIPEAKSEPMVLIVDDSITVRELLSMTFNKAGYRVEQARDGQEAWDKLRSGLPCDIVFCDIEMPRMDGLELLSRLQKEENLRKLPIAMLTSRGADRHRQMASQLGASGYFTKPYLEEVLLEAAQRMIKGEVLFGSSSNA
jgi:chemosensory pili system protein ChpA (sensor histidine kinase/response regulator)